MGKRLVIAVSALVLAASVSLASVSFLKQACRELTESAYAVIESEEQGRDSRAMYERLTEKWKSSEKLLGMIMKHADADTLDRYFLMLDQFYKNGEFDSAVRVLREIISFLEVAYEGEKLSAENIF